MKKKLKIIAVFVLFLLLFLPLNQRMFCEENGPSISWRFEPHIDRYVHVEAVVRLIGSTDSYRLLEVQRGIWIKDARAYEYESGTPIELKVYYDIEIKEQVIEVFFSQPISERFTFVIEFDLMDFMEEKEDKVFIFEWWHKSYERESHTAVVFLPKGSELLDLQYWEPVKVEEEEQVIIYYEGIGEGYFNFYLVFSPSGKNYAKWAKRHEESGDYDLALSYYKRAMSIYGRYSYYMETKPETIRDIRERILVIQKREADTIFEEATEAFEQKEYEKAQSQFEKAETLYRALKDTEKESECEEMITAIERFGAEVLLEQGRIQYGDKEFQSAKDSFVQAKNKFEELGNAEKVSECEEMITECEENLFVEEAVSRRVRQSTPPETVRGETLLELAKAQYEARDIMGARDSFMQAENRFKEQGDTERVSECEEWLDTVEEIYRTMLVSILGVMVISLALWKNFRGEFGGGFEYQSFFKELLAIGGILFVSLGVLLHSIFLEMAVVFAFCAFTAWVSFHYREFITGRSHPLRDSSSTRGGLVLVILCIFLFGLLVVFLFQSGLIITGFFVVFFFFLWGLLFKEMFRKS